MVVLFPMARPCQTCAYCKGVRAPHLGRGRAFDEVGIVIIFIVIEVVLLIEN